MSSNIAIKIEGLHKAYRIGEIGTGTLSHDLNRRWALMRGKEDPYAKVGSLNDRTQKAEKGEIVAALNNFNLEIKKGEVLGIIGKNGAGKSTLLKLLSRVTSPSRGRININGRMASLLEVGTGFHPEMTGRENIYMNGTVMGMRRWEIKNKLDEIVEFAGIAKYLDTPTKRYSSGMTVRLGFAVAAFLEPEILVVDEVLAVGDAEFQRKAIGKMDDISRNDERTILFVSHNMGTIRNLCKRAILLKNGELHMDDAAGDVVDHYLNDGAQVIGVGPISKDQPREYNSGEAFFTDIRLLNDENQEVGIVNFKSNPRFQLELEMTKAMEKVIFGFHILNTMGQELMYTEFPEGDKSFYSFEKGKHLLRFSFGAGLVPGDYRLRVNMMYPNGNAIDLIDNVAQFSVSRDSASGSHNFRWNKAKSTGFVTAEKIQFNKSKN